MERSSEDLRQEVETKKEAIADNQPIGSACAKGGHWRAQVGDHPYLALGLRSAWVVCWPGFSKQAQSARADHGALAEGVEDIADQARNRIGSISPARQAAR